MFPSLLCGPDIKFCQAIWTNVIKLVVLILTVPPPSQLELYHLRADLIMSDPIFFSKQP